MNYKEARISESDPGKREILIAFLGEIGFESFEETPDGLNAYIPSEVFDKSVFDETLRKLHEPLYTLVDVPRQNWNETWEKNFKPVRVGDVYIRAPFHDAIPGITYELIIEPKMSFGTGHHSTTSLMILEMSGMNFKGTSVLDMGCGTSVLAILASKMGADPVIAIDIDDWAVENSIENCSRNGVSNVEVKKGNVDSITGKKFDIILANINRNILLEDIPRYAGCLLKGGELIVSGFYEKDETDIGTCASQNGLVMQNRKSMNKWSVMRFRKAS